MKTFRYTEKSFTQMESACMFICSFVSNQQHFKDETFEFSMAFLYDFEVLN